VRGGGGLGGGGGRLPVGALVAGLAALCAAALVAGAFDGAPPERPRPGPEAGLAVAAGGGGPAGPPISRLCFRGPRGEPVDFAAVDHCPRAAADGGPRLAGAAPQ
jgi:hypothetical protein